MMGSGTTGCRGEKRLQRYLFEKTDFEAHRDNVTGMGFEVVVAGPEVGHGEMPRTGEFQTIGDERGVQIKDTAKLNFEAQLGDRGRDGVAIGDPCTGVGERVGKREHDVRAVAVAVSVDIERLHSGKNLMARIRLP